jgi:UDP-N-acetylmuramyl pentapeptide phosphotransferase/UDP-N-acetylglucosamine-1-phosphate transferase
MVRVGRMIGFVDVPDGVLKDHTGAPVPLGGAGVLAGLAVGLTIAGSVDPGLAVAVATVFVVGLADDRLSLSPVVRLLAVAVAGALLVVFSPSVSGVWASLAGVGLVLVSVNSVNLLDGLDGLAGSVTSVGAIGLVWFGLTVGAQQAWEPAVLSAAIVGFLALNLPPARSFLGDNGAYVIGVTLAWSVLHVSGTWVEGLVAAALLGVPVLDMGSTIARRLREGSPLFTGDRGHFYDRMRSRGSSVGAICLAYSATQAAWMAVVMIVWAAWGEVPALITALVGGLAVVAAGSRVWSAGPGTQ